MSRVAKVLLAASLLSGISSFAHGQTPGKNPHGDIKIECGLCHTFEAWDKLKNQSEFKHESTGFALIGAHDQLRCVNCHNNLTFTNTAIECADCHTDVHRNQFGIECQNCHTPHSWQNLEDVLRLHSSRGFPLVGVHAIVDCDACHLRQGREEFVGTPLDCRECHMENFASSVNPDHELAGFETNCEECHASITAGWSQTVFDHGPDFPIRGAHLSAECSDCHTVQYAGTTNLCGECHQADFASAEEPNHVDMGFPTACEACHNEVAWEGAFFDHLVSTGFEIRGAHTGIDCTECHAQNQLDLPTNCIGCHQEDYNNVPDPDHVSGNFPDDCLLCHSESAWEPARFDHNQTAFPLTGAHATLVCDACHAGGQYQGTPAECFACHESDYNSVSDPNHVTNNFDTDCTVCHSTVAWSPSTFDHSQTQFPLTGAHASLECQSCHADGYNDTPTDCFACHEGDFNSVVEPNHVTNNFDHDCAMCHNTIQWAPSTFDHGQTQFPISGAHVGVECIDCHSGGYENTPTDCYSCHAGDFNSVPDPDHNLNGFSHDCTQCHTVNGWLPVSFDHSQTRFPLTGAHAGLPCEACHADGYDNTPTDCFSCHEADYNSVTEPDHVTNNFDHDCTICHSTNAWLPSTFDHSQTLFPLTGAHISLDCIQCHADGYDNTPTDCYSCHDGDYNSVPDPDHNVNGFSHDCLQCHTTSGWLPVNFDHSGTQFPLTGAHVGLDCELCHEEGYDNTPTDCFSCHEGDYNSVPDPDHNVNGFSHDCTQCHTTNGWLPVNFDHSNTQFPLTGAHVGLECVLCHADGYENTPTDCYSCHLSDYNSVQDPNHVTNNFSHDCTECHTTSGWSPAQFDHSQTQFPLTGAHLSLECIACHADGYENTPTDCYACHAGDYNGSTDPNHLQFGFPTDCQMCHNTNGWDSNWNHDGQYFPIFSGRHAQEWNNCADCHVIPEDYGSFECIFCHAHNQPDMDNAHDEVPGYSYNSQACFTCHPDGERP